MNIRAFFDKYLGWCPMSPDLSPPQKDGVTNFLDDFLAGWRNYFITISLLSIILASSILFTPPPLIPAFTTPETWDKVLEQTYDFPDHYKWIGDDPSVNISGQTIISGNEQLIFQDQTVAFPDLLWFQNNSQLILRNCTFLVPTYTGYYLEDIFHEYVGILFTDNSSLIAIDTVFVPYDRRAGIGFLGDSSCSLDNVIIANSSINLDERAKLIANNSKIWQIYTDKDTRLEITSSQIGYLYNDHKWRSHWSNVLKIASPTARFTNSSIYFTEIRIVNSSRCIISDDIGYQSNWNLYEDYQIDGRTMNITLIDSEIEGYLMLDGINSVFNVTGSENLWLYATNSEVYCKNSELLRLSLAGNSSAEINNSNIYSLGLSLNHAYTLAQYRLYPASSRLHRVKISDSRIESLSISSNSEIECNRVYIEETSIDTATAKIHGSYICNNVESTAYNQYERWALTSSYTVNTIGEERVLPGVELTLVDQAGNIVWSGISNDDGMAQFNITYCSYYPLTEPYQYVTNYEEVWNITGVYGDEVKTCQLSMAQLNSNLIIDYTKDKFVLPINNRILFYSSIVLILITTAMKLRLHLSNNEPFGGN